MTDTHIDLLSAMSAKEAALINERMPMPKPKPTRKTHSMNTEAPIVMLRYECSVCLTQVALDPYDGPPTCESGHYKAWMRAVSLLSDVDPLADLRDGAGQGGVR